MVKLGKRSNSLGERNEAPVSEVSMRTNMPSSYQNSGNLDSISANNPTQEAEDSILSNLEAQTRRTKPLADGFRPAVPGERAPLRVETVGTSLDEGDNNSPPQRDIHRPTFKQMAKRVQTMNLMRKSVGTGSSVELSSTPQQHQSPSVTSSNHGSGGESVSTSGYSRGSSQGEAAAAHRRAKTLLESIDEATEQSEVENMESHELVTDLSTDLFSADIAPQEHQEGLAYLWNQYEQDEEELLGEQAEAAIAASDRLSDENKPLLGEKRDAAAIIMERRRLAQQRRSEMRWRQIRSCFNPCKMMERILHAIFESTLVVSIPFFIIAGILFYHVGNPELDFLPGNATISWWFNFFGRQLVLFDLARFTQFILIDILTMSSKAVVQMLGPWVTIFCLQSRGWPFVVAFWGFFDLIFLQGDNPFQTHWLYWTGIEIYSIGNSGSYILASSAYFRVLLGMIIAGLATTFKRTVLTLYFGKRTFDIYKPKLEEILNDIIVVTEIAELGAEADTLPEDEGNQLDTKQLVHDNIIKRGQLSEVRWSSLKFNDKTREDLADTDDEASLGVPKKTDSGEQHPMRGLMARTSPMNTSSTFKIKNLLDQWEEPVNKLDKNSGSSLNDILKFRKALTYMDLEYPFGEAFGPASTRNELIKSAQILYHRLLKLAPGSSALPNSVMSVLSENEDGTIDMDIKKSINNLFPADGDGEIPILAFIQNCDVVYRRLRYFRASVGNSSVIDKVLEAIIDGFFSLGLTVVILSLLHFNPWPLLVSMSTLLVSFAFAIGPTAAKAIEGILLIVGTRPFDIGDRIIIANTPGLPPANAADSWFVEDISLFSTTIRFAGNNEVASVSNGSIASTRITNCARSKNAVIYIPLKLHISLHDGLNVEKFKDGMQHYVNDNPEAFDGLAFFACNSIDSNAESVSYDLCVRSRHSWQEAGRVLEDRGRLFQYSIELAKEMKVNFDAPASQQVLYYGGELKDGGIKDYKRNLLMDRTNISRNGPATNTLTNEKRAGDGAAPEGAADNNFLHMLKQSHDTFKIE